MTIISPALQLLLLFGLSSFNGGLAHPLPRGSNHTLPNLFPPLVSVRSRALKKAPANIEFRNMYPPSGASVVLSSDQVFSAIVQDLDGFEIKSVKLKYQRDDGDVKKYRSKKFEQVTDSKWETSLDDLEPGTYRWKIEAKNKEKAKAKTTDSNETPFILYVLSSLPPIPLPTPAPTHLTTKEPTNFPSSTPEVSPSLSPSALSTKAPSERPSSLPTEMPTEPPALVPTELPTEHPTTTPSPKPSPSPTDKPTSKPTAQPTSKPTGKPTSEPTGKPAGEPTDQPTSRLTDRPSDRPSPSPTSFQAVPMTEQSPTIDVAYGTQQSCFTINTTRYDICLDLVGPIVGVTEPWMAAFAYAKARWEQVIVGHVNAWSNLGPILDAYDVNYGTEVPSVVDDIYIVGEEDDFDGDGEGKVLGSAGPILVATSTNIPVTGSMRFDSADIPWLMAEGLWLDVILHEMGHVLGIGSVWEVNEYNSYYEYIGPIAKEEWKKLCSTNAPPIEMDGGDGTAGGHWDEDCLGNELMTGYLDAGPNAVNALSSITIAALEDIGYSVSYATADNSFQMDPSCCYASRNRKLLRKKTYGSTSESTDDSNELSATLYEIAAQQAAKEMKKARDNAPPHIPVGYRFIGGDFINILVRDEHGRIRDKSFQWNQVAHRA